MKFEEIKKGTELVFINDTFNVYTNGSTYEVVSVNSLTDIQVMDNDDFPHDWDFEYLQDEFVIK